MQPHERDLLRQLHRASRIPVDQWAQRPKFMSRFTDQWNDLTGRNDTGDDRVRFTNPISPAAASAGNLRGAGYGRVA